LGGHGVWKLEREAAIPHPAMTETYGCPIENSVKLINTRVQTYSTLSHSKINTQWPKFPRGKLLKKK